MVTQKKIKNENKRENKKEGRVMPDTSETDHIDFRYNLKLYSKLILKYKWVLFGLLGMIVLIEMIHVLDKYLFKVLVDKSTEFVNTTITQNQLMTIIMMVLAVFVFTTLVKVLARWIHIHLINILDGNVMLDTKKMFLDHLVQLSYEFHTTHKTGSLISKLIRSAGAIERMTDTIVFNFTPLIIQVVVTSLSIIYFDKISAAFVLLTVVLFIGYSFVINQRQQKANIDANEAEDREKASISDIFTNIESIKYFGKERIIKEKYLGIGEETKRAMIHHWNYFRWLSAGQSLILNIGIILVMGFPLMKVVNGEMTVGTLVFIYTVFFNLVGNLFGFDHGIRNFYRSMADFEALFKFYKVQNDIVDLPKAKKLKMTSGEIELKNISFSYKKRKIFSKFSLKIPANRKVAIVGSSGAGKSTLIKLIYRFYDVEEGEILVDGENIKNFNQQSLRSELSIVPQECVLFDDTIYNNIAFSKPGATRKEVLQAMKFAQLDKIVALFPNKEKTIVGERGVKLSGGEKQRVSIARAILADRKVLVLDEATSSLDSETESEIQRDLFRLMKNRTSIIIAHRLSTIMKADVIVVLKRGRIDQMGTHNQLIRKKGIYNKLWNLQKGGYLEKEKSGKDLPEKE